MDFADEMMNLAEYCEMRGYVDYATLLLECAAADSLFPMECQGILTLPDWLLRLVHRIAYAVEYTYDTAQTWYMAILESCAVLGKVIHICNDRQEYTNYYGDEGMDTLGKGTPISAEAVWQFGLQ